MVSQNNILLKGENTMKKKIIAVIMVMTMTLGTSTTVFAVTPQYHSWVLNVPEITWDSLSDESKDIIDNVVKDIVGNIDFDTVNKLSTPVITEATYHHGRCFYDKTRLQVRWDKVTDAEYYEIRITKKDGVSKIYKTKNTSIFIYEKSNEDDFIIGCVRSGKVEVRACNDSESSAWSDAKTITCNRFHSYKQ